MEETKDVIPDQEIILAQEIILNTDIKPEKIKPEKIDVPETIAKVILEKLIVFENELGFLKPNINQAEFAKELDTNSSYLSKTINHYKEQNFSQYLNSLRIDYTIQKLKEDSYFRKISIKALAEEMGFGNQETFSKAFYAKTGLQPSYFINKLKEIKNDTIQ